jgi:tryptophan 2,3-dioxygenase
MPSPSAEEPHETLEELHAALDAIPADEARNDLRRSLQLLMPLWEQMPQRLDVLEACLDAVESRGNTGMASPSQHFQEIQRCAASRKANIPLGSAK